MNAGGGGLEREGTRGATTHNIYYYARRLSSGKGREEAVEAEVLVCPQQRPPA